jgi:hypothetical protein
MNMIRYESYIPMDVWMDIFQAIQESGDFEGLKHISSVNRTFRAALSPRIFASVRIIPFVESPQETELRFMHVAHLVTHLSIHEDRDPTSQDQDDVYFWGARIVAACHPQFNHIQSMCLINSAYQDFDELYTFLSGFPALRKLEVEELMIRNLLDMLELQIPAARLPILRLEEMHTKNIIYEVLATLINSLCGTGQHLRRLRVVLFDLELFSKILAPWLNNPACLLTHLDILFQDRRGRFKSGYYLNGPLSFLSTNLSPVSSHAQCHFFDDHLPQSIFHSIHRQQGFSSSPQH